MKLYSFLRGLKYRTPEARELAASLRPETELKLFHEHTNSEDPNAVQVWYEGEFLGYIQAELSALVAPVADSARCFVESVGRTPFLRIES